MDTDLRREKVIKKCNYALEYPTKAPLHQLDVDVVDQGVAKLTTGLSSIT